MGKPICVNTRISTKIPENRNEAKVENIVLRKPEGDANAHATAVYA